MKDNVKRNFWDTKNVGRPSFIQATRSKQEADTTPAPVPREVTTQRSQSKVCKNI